MVEVDLPEALQRFGKKLAVASLGAIEKKDGSYRVVHDGTHGVAVNSAIRVRDQIRSPGAGELRTLLQELQGPCFGLTGDVTRAHRLSKVATQDWGLQACKTGVGGPNKLWLNKVGTLGISSAAYHWSRLMSGIGRAAFCLLGRSEIYMLIYVDDILWLARVDKSGVERICMVIFVFVVLGLPFSWRKFMGSEEFGCVGFVLNVRECKLGLTISAASSVVGAVAESDPNRELCEDCRCQRSVGSLVMRWATSGPFLDQSTHGLQRWTTGDRIKCRVRLL